MKKRKLNWVSVGNMVGLIASGMILLETFYKLALEPFFTNKLTGLTYFGLIVTLLAIITFSNCLEYFEERIK